MAFREGEFALDQSERLLSGEGRGLPDEEPSPLAEQWPYLRFLGLGAWWAWIWLCYFSTTLVGAFPDETRPSLVLSMYLISTLAIGLTMVIAAGFHRRATILVDSRGPVVFAGVVAALATAALAYSGSMGGVVPFTVAAVLTGACTGALCLKVGRLYGTVNLSGSLTAGAMSLVVAALLFFVGQGIPAPWRVAFVAFLPLLSALLLCMPQHDPYEGDESLEEKTHSVDRSVMVLYGRLVAAAAAVAMTAGVARGISSSVQATEGYGFEGSLIVAIIGLTGVALVWLVNRMAVHRKGARIAYTALMIAGIALMLATCFGVPISYLSIGKETLWLVLSCLMAFMAFRFGFSSVRAFALGQAAYYLASTAGWGIGALVAPAYDDPTVRMAVGAVMAFAVVLILTLLFTERDIRSIVLTPVTQPVSVVSKNVAMPASCSAGCPMKGSTSATVDDAAGVSTLGSGASTPSMSPSESPVFAAPEGGAAVELVDPRQQLLEERYGLSLREIEIMDLFAQGRSANWIADALFISKNTVRSHLRAIYGKLDVHTRQEPLDRLNALI